MSEMNRRKFLGLAASFGATLAWSSPSPGSVSGWREQRDAYPQGVASADPHPDSVWLWTRRPPLDGKAARQLSVEVGAESDFRKVVAKAVARISAETDWTCRVLAAGLQPGRTYWYRFTDEFGLGSRIGRTITAPSSTDTRPVHFTFVSCQNVQQGACNAYRRMIFEDEHRAESDQLDFVLHLGDYIYEVVWYPEDRPQGMYSRRLRDIVRYKSGEKISDFHIPTTVEDYRSIYRAYLLDPDLQDARARWPFICMWDNHEFSWKGWQSQQNFSGVRPAQTRKVAAAQAWFEYQPARVIKATAQGIDRYDPPKVSDKPLAEYDDHGLGLEADNIAAINSLKLFRSFRYGKHVDLILTDNRSFRSEPIGDQATTAPFQPRDFPYTVPQEVIEILDAGRTFNGGRPPETIRFNGKDLPNPRKDAPAQSLLGAAQKKWFVTQLRESKTTWKLWGNSVGMLNWRLDFQNLPNEPGGVRWPATGYASISSDDWSTCSVERSEILNLIHREGITGLVTVAGDRHSFQAGLLSESLPPKRFEPVAVEFVTGSVSAPTMFEGASYNLPKDHPLRSVYLYKPADGSAVQPAINLSLMHGVKSGLEMQKSGDLRRALAVSNPEVAPHLSFMDLSGHGYAVVRAGSDALDVEFVCIRRPVERSESPDGGPLAYRVLHRVKLWPRGEAPRLEKKIIEGTPPLIV